MEWHRANAQVYQAKIKYSKGSEQINFYSVFDFICNPTHSQLTQNLIEKELYRNMSKYQKLLLLNFEYWLL